MTKDMRTELLELIKKNAYFREKIILSSGKESDYYIDARLITLTSKGAYLCAQLMLELIKDEEYKSIGGPTLGADPLIGAIGVVSLQQNNPINTFIIRKTNKGHGKKQLIEGPLLSKGDRVVIIDDVATTGKAFLYSIEVLKELGIEVVKAVCVVDRQEGAVEAVREKGVEMVSIFKASEIHVV